jgi:hypothetical protein
VAVQAVIPESEADVGSGFVTFSFFLGGAIFVALGQTIFINRIGPALLKYAPQIPKEEIIKMGATGVRKYFTGVVLEKVVLAYNQALTQSYVSQLSILSMQRLKTDCFTVSGRGCSRNCDDHKSGYGLEELAPCR